MFCTIFLVIHRVFFCVDMSQPQSSYFGIGPKEILQGGNAMHAEKEKKNTVSHAFHCVGNAYQFFHDDESIIRICLFQSTTVYCTYYLHYVICTLYSTM